MRPELEEVNFWFPGEKQRFAGLKPGEPFFFKLKGRYDAIAGFGQFSRFEWMPVWLAWEVFGEANGVRTEPELLDRLGRLHAGKRPTDRIGCVFVAFPVFFTPDDWVERPRDWKPNAVRGLFYDLAGGEGRRIWDECTARAASPATAIGRAPTDPRGARVARRRGVPPLTLEGRTSLGRIGDRGRNGLWRSWTPVVA